MVRLLFSWVDESGVLPELIDPVRVDVEWNHNSEETGNTIIMGIEYDSRFRPVAYWVNDNYSVSPCCGRKCWAKRGKNTDSSQEHSAYFPPQVNQKRGFLGFDRFKPFIPANRFGKLHCWLQGLAQQKWAFLLENELEYTGDGSVTWQLMPKLARLKTSVMRFQAFDPTYPAGEYKTFQRRF